jgi:hypothetical protein
VRYRKLDANGDMQFGRGLSDFWINVPDAVAQAVETRLALQLGEWFLDTTDGTPWNTRVLGKYTGSTRDAVLQARTLGTPNLTGIASFSSGLNRETRAYTVKIVADTAYGQILFVGPV